MTPRRPLAALLPLVVAGGLLAGCGDAKPAAGPAAPSPTAASPSSPACAPLNRYLVAGRLLATQLAGQDRRAAPYLQHVVDSGIAALQQTKTATSGPPQGDAVVTLQYWTSLRITLAAVGFDVAKLTKAQDDALGDRGRILGSAEAADRLASYGTTTCGPGVNPTQQQLDAFS